MQLERPSEPIRLREEVLRFLRRHPQSREEGGHSVADPLTYWYGNKLPRYLWKSGWGPKLSGAGLDPDRFMRTIGAHRKGFFRWIDGVLPWDQFLDLIVLSVTKTAESLQSKAKA